MAAKNIRATKNTIANDTYLYFRKFESKKLKKLTKEQYDEFYIALKDYVEKNIFSDSFKVLKDDKGRPNLLQIGFPDSIWPLAIIGNHIKLFHFFKPPQTVEEYAPVVYKKGQSDFPIKQIFTGFFFESENNISKTKLLAQEEFYWFAWGELILHKNLIDKFKFATDETKRKWKETLATSEQNSSLSKEEDEPTDDEDSTDDEDQTYEKDLSDNEILEEKSNLKEEEVNEIISRLIPILAVSETKDESNTSSNESETDTESEQEQTKWDSKKSIKSNVKQKLDKRPTNKTLFESKLDREVAKSSKTKLSLKSVSVPIKDDDINRFNQDFKKKSHKTTTESKNVRKIENKSFKNSVPASNEFGKSKKISILSNEGKTLCNKVDNTSSIKSVLNSKQQIKNDGYKTNEIANGKTKHEYSTKSDQDHVVVKKAKASSELSLNSVSIPNKTDKACLEVKNKCDNSQKAMSSKVLDKCNSEIHSNSKPPIQKDSGSRTKMIVNDNFDKKKHESSDESKPYHKFAKTDATKSNTLKRTVESVSVTNKLDNASGEVKKPKICSQKAETKSKVASESSIKSSKEKSNSNHNIANPNQNEIATKGTDQKLQKRSHESTEESKANRKIEISRKRDATSPKTEKLSMKSVSSDSGKDKNKHFCAIKDETKSNNVPNKKKIESDSNSKPSNFQNASKTNKSDEPKLDKSNKDSNESKSFRKIKKEKERAFNSSVDNKLKKMSPSSVQPMEVYRTGGNPKAINHSVATDSEKSKIKLEQTSKQQTARNLNTETHNDKPKKRKLIEKNNPSISAPIDATKRANKGSTRSGPIYASKIVPNSNQNQNRAIQPKIPKNKVSPSNLYNYYNRPSTSSNKPKENAGEIYIIGKNMNLFVDALLGKDVIVPTLTGRIQKLQSRPTEQNASSDAPNIENLNMGPSTSKCQSSSKHSKLGNSEKLSSGSKGPLGSGIHKESLSSEKSSQSDSNHHNYPQMNKQIGKLTKTNNSRPYISSTKELPNSESEHLDSKTKESLPDLKVMFNGSDAQPINDEISVNKTSCEKTESFADSAICCDSVSQNSLSDSNESNEQPSKIASPSASQSIPMPQSIPEKCPLEELAEKGRKLLAEELKHYRALVLTMVHYARECSDNRKNNYILTAVHYVDEANGDNIDQNPVTTRILRVSIRSNIDPGRIKAEFNRLIRDFDLYNKYLVVVTEDSLKSVIPSQYPQLSQDIIESMLTYLNPPFWSNIKLCWTKKSSSEAEQIEEMVGPELERYRKPHRNMPLEDGDLRLEIQNEINDYNNKIKPDQQSYNIEEAINSNSPTVVDRIQFPNLYKATNFYRSFPIPSQIEQIKQTLVNISSTNLRLINTDQLTRCSASDWSFIKLNKDLFESAEFRSLHGNNVYDKIDVKMYGFDC